MAVTRSYSEFNKKMSDFMRNGIAPCPDCGAELPAGDTDVRMAHFAACPGKRVDAPAITIDAEFEALIPPLSEEERAALEQSLLTEGCRDALVIWVEKPSTHKCYRDDNITTESDSECDLQTGDGVWTCRVCQHNPAPIRRIVIDGHNRYRICQTHGIAYKVLEREFASRDDVIVWMVQNQLARRNLTDFARAELALKSKDAIARKAKANQAVFTGNQYTSGDLANLPKVQKVNTRQEVASIAGVSERTLPKVENVVQHAPEPVKQKARNGEISISRADELTKALQGKPQPVIDLALRVAGDNPEKVDILAQLHKSSKRDGSNETFAEIEASGGFHYEDGKDEKAWCNFAEDDIRTIKKALASIAKRHAQLAQDEIEAQRDATRPTAKRDVPTPELHCARAEALPLTDSSVDIIITSPPYNMGDDQWNMGGQGRTKRAAGIGYEDAMPEADYQAWQLDCLTEFYRVAKDGASLFYNHKERYRNGCAILPTDWLRNPSNPWTLRQTIIWDRGSTHNHNPAYFYPETEFIYWLTKGKPRLPDRPIGLSCVWQCHGAVPNTWHPAPFVEALPEMLLNAVGTQDKLIVLDPFAGSGTTLKVALRYGYHAIGVDVNPEYINEMKARNQW